MSNFQKVIDFNKQFGVTTNDEPVLDIFDKDPSLIKYRLSLIDEEVKELHESVQNKDFIETVDALADILYVVYGFGCSIGVEMDEIFKLVHDNNMSKLCSSEEEAKQTVAYYLDNQKKLGYDSPSYRKAPDDKHWVVFNKSTNKVLKSINWKQVNLKNIIKIDNNFKK